jgi:hypothetical protein
MMAAATRPVQQRASQLARLWWLPADGYGNGLGDSSWVPALEISGQVVPPVLSALRDAGVRGARRARGPRASGPVRAADGLAALGRRERIRPCRSDAARRDAVPCAGGGRSRRRRMAVTLAAGLDRRAFEAVRARRGPAARRHLSRVIARRRPPAEAWLAEPEGFSLPSKHTTLAVLTVGAAARAIGIRGAPAIAATAIAAAGVGASRICLGVHWPADVVAGWLFAAGWLRLTDPDRRVQ